MDTDDCGGVSSGDFRTSVSGGFVDGLDGASRCMRKTSADAHCNRIDQPLRPVFVSSRYDVGIVVSAASGGTP